MDKQTFLNELSEKLAELGVGSESIRRHIKQFERYFANMSEQEAEDQISGLGSVEELALNIYDLLIKKNIKKVSEVAEADAGNAESGQAETAAGDISAANEDTDADNKEISEGSTEFSDPDNNNAEQVRTTVKAEIENGIPDMELIDETQSEDGLLNDEGFFKRHRFQNIKSVRGMFKKTPDGENVSDTRKIDAVDSEAITSDRQTDADESENDDIPKDPPLKQYRQQNNNNLSIFDGASNEEEVEQAININELDERYTSPQGSTKQFWLLFALTPTVCLTVALAFAAAFFAIAALIISAVAALVAIVAAGTGLSLFGIIYGITQTFSSVPVGLYEIGLGIIIGGVSILTGILVYNFAVRLMPYTAKWLLVFMKYVIRKAKKLYIYVKRECIG